MPDSTTRYCWPALGHGKAVVGFTTASVTAAGNPSHGDPATVLPEERRAAREQGYAEGQRQGREDALAEQAAVLSQLQAAAGQFLDELQAEKTRARKLLRWLLQTLAEELSVQQLNRSPELLDRLLDEAASDVGLPSQGLTVIVAPGLETWWQKNEFRDDVVVQVSDALAPGLSSCGARYGSHSSIPGLWSIGCCRQHPMRSRNPGRQRRRRNPRIGRR